MHNLSAFVPLPQGKGLSCDQSTSQSLNLTARDSIQPYFHPSAMAVSKAVMSMPRRIQLWADCSRATAVSIALAIAMLVAARCVQIALDRRQRDIDDRGVKDHDELRDRQKPQGKPTTRVRRANRLGTRNDGGSHVRSRQLSVRTGEMIRRLMRHWPSCRRRVSRWFTLSSVPSAISIRPLDCAVTTSSTSLEITTFVT